MELANHNTENAMASVLKDGLIVIVSVVLKKVILGAMVFAPKKIGPAMENVLRVGCIAVVIVTLNHILTHIFMIAMDVLASTFFLFFFT